VRIETSYVDFSGIDRITPEYLREVTRLYRAVDPHWVMRVAFGSSLNPPEVKVLSIGSGIVQLSRVVA
jgi:hypothetical protein